jgi:hypothetical protein
MAAIEAGKHVYREWPLARDPDEAQQIPTQRNARDRIPLDAKNAPGQLVVNRIVGEGTVVSFQIRGGVMLGIVFLLEIQNS